MTNAKLCLLALLTFIYLPGQAAESIQRVTLEQSQFQNYALLTHDENQTVKQIWVLMMGGDGDVGMSMVDGKVSYRGRGLVIDGRQRFLRPGSAVVILDSPSQMPKMVPEFRTTPAYLEAAQAAIQAVSAQFPGAKLYLVGHSNGAISAMHLAAQLKEKVAGVIALSSSYRTPQSLVGVEPSQPAFFIRHVKDQCSSSYQSDALKQRYATLSIEDNDANLPGRCGPNSTHHFTGQEDLVIDAMYRWAAGESFR